VAVSKNNIIAFDVTAPYYIPTISDAPISDKEQSYPFVIFSHGYAATRFVCSDFCNTLASYGFIVAAIEHRSVIKIIVINNIKIMKTLELLDII